MHIIANEQLIRNPADGRIAPLSFVMKRHATRIRKTADPNCTACRLSPHRADANIADKIIAANPASQAFATKGEIAVRSAHMTTKPSPATISGFIDSALMYAASCTNGSN